jgi:hypothetical protein
MNLVKGCGERVISSTCELRMRQCFVEGGWLDMNAGHTAKLRTSMSEDYNIVRIYIYMMGPVSPILRKILNKETFFIIYTRYIYIYIPSIY